MGDAVQRLLDGRRLPDGWHPVEAELVRELREREDARTGLLAVESVRTLTVRLAAFATTDPHRDALMGAVEAIAGEGSEVRDLRADRADRR